MTVADIRHGLALRFEVTVDNHKLGAWSKCEGLGVDFKPKPYTALGNNAYAHQLPGPATYPNIKLTRACTKDTSQEVATWLNSMLHPERRKKGTATIILYDGWAEKVTSWGLRNVLPASWKGPSLDAGAAKVALEVLELAHEGFDELPEHGQPSPAVLHGPGREAVRFSLNPSKLTVSRRSQWDSQPSLGGNSGQPATQSSRGSRGSAHQASQPQNACHTTPTHKGNKPASLKVTVMLDASFSSDDQPASSVPNSISTLEQWTCAPRAAPKGSTPHPPLLVFTWGSINFPGYMQNLTINYTMVTPDGTPLRADVDMTLVEAPRPDQGTNPTSGGLAGRRAYTVADGDSLQSVAYREYGDANLWRSLAETNDIHDPMRLPPGTTLLLLSPAELT
jgi:phage tail-like protein